MKAIGTMFLVMIVVGGCVALAYSFTGPAQRVVQPIAFNHAIHIGEASLTCTDCHTDAATGTFAGLPRKSACLDCHDVDEEQGSNAEKDKLFAFDESDRQIPWKRVAITRPDVFFSHRRHVAAAKLDCLDCHLDQPTLTTPPRTARVVMTMNTCIECHEEQGVTTDCLRCHR